MTERPEVSLRRFEHVDAGAVHRWFNNPAATASIAAGLWDRWRHGASGRWEKAEGTR